MKKRLNREKERDIYKKKKRSLQGRYIYEEILTKPFI